jgi:bifunctional UDP-N-acetylglucosamine pyrophosphorylase/glucosamine-1-phosphate N-acetyltransferase
VRIGSDTMLVAPVVIGDGAYTAAGSVIVDDVPPGALAVGRGRQRNVEGWVEKKRPGSASARSAARSSAKGADLPRPDLPQEAPTHDNGAPDESQGDPS